MPINKQSLIMTYSPYKGIMMEGDHSAFDMSSPGIDMHIYKHYLATLKRNLQSPTSSLRAEYQASDPKGSYKRSGFPVRQSTWKVQYAGALNQQLVMKIKQKEAEQSFYASLQGGQGYDPTPALALAQSYEASAPPGVQDSATGKVSPLTQIPFIQDVLGIPNEQYFINELFTKVTLPQLHAEIPEVDWVAAQLQLAPTQRLNNEEPDFISHFFDAKRNEVPYLLPREYRFRATIDPLNLYADAAARALREAREALSLLSLSSLNAAADTPDPATDITNGFPAAENNTKQFWEGLMADHWKSFRILIDSCTMSPRTFVSYESNFFTKGFAPYADVEIWGLVNLPGFKRPIRVAVSPFTPDDQIYFFNSRYAYTGEGPQITETWAKPEINSDAGTWRDYVDIVIFNTIRAGFKTKIVGTSPTEITTLEEARDLVKPPTNVLNANP